MGTKSDMLNRVYQKVDDIIHRKIVDETILVPLRGELVDMQKIFSLNQVADCVWEHLDGKRDLMEICKQVETLFDAGPAQVHTDVVDFINELMDAKLVFEVQ